jgi:glutaredoxin
VVIFTTTRCRHCDRAKAFLRSRRVPFRERNLSGSPGAVAEFRRLGARGVPVILVGQRRIDGFEPGLLADALRRAGLTG